MLLEEQHKKITSAVAWKLSLARSQVQYPAGRKDRRTELTQCTSTVREDRGNQRPPSQAERSCAQQQGAQTAVRSLRGVSVWHRRETTCAVRLAARAGGVEVPARRWKATAGDPPEGCDLAGKCLSVPASSLGPSVSSCWQIFTGSLAAWLGCSGVRAPVALLSCRVDDARANRSDSGQPAAAAAVFTPAMLCFSRSQGSPRGRTALDRRCRETYRKGAGFSGLPVADVALVPYQIINHRMLRVCELELALELLKISPIPMALICLNTEETTEVTGTTAGDGRDFVLPDEETRLKGTTEN